MVSPWADALDLPSPDGRRRALIPVATEVGMGAPTAGVLEVEGVKLAACSPSAVWSEDSSFLAVPQWTGEGRQRLLVLAFPGPRVLRAPGVFSLLQLESFANGAIVGVDSPFLHPRPLAVAASTLVPHELLEEA